MKHVLFYFILMNFITGCLAPSGMYREDVMKYAAKYADKLESGSQLTHAAYHFSVEKTLSNTYIEKVYFPETGQITKFTTYQDFALRMKDGKSMEWYDNGNKQNEGEYKNNKRNGFWKHYIFSSKYITSSGNYINDQKEGNWQFFSDSTGVLEGEYRYENDKRNGASKEWNEKGTLIAQGTYANDILIKEERLDTDEQAAVKHPINEVQPEAYGKDCEHIKNQEERRSCGNEKLMTFISNNLRYPLSARERGIQGTAYVRFVVEKDGSVTDIIVLKGVCQDIKDECIRIMKLMPKWSPGLQDGQPVRVLFTLPFSFKLS